MTVAVVVLAAGSSRRLGRPKQLLDYRGATLLDATLATARAAAVDQVVVALGGAADEVARAGRPDGRRRGAQPRLRRRLQHLDPVRARPRSRDDADGVVLLLGDQPGVTPATVAALVAGAAGSAVGVCEYDDGLGHPLWFDRGMFDVLTGLHGDKAVWKLVDAGEDVVAGPGRRARSRADVDTWDDYQALLEAAAMSRAASSTSGRRGTPPLRRAAATSPTRAWRPPSS